MKPSPDTVVPVLKAPPAKPSPDKAQHLADQGHYREALEEYRAIQAGSPGNREILAAYQATIDRILANADADYLRYEFSAAGRTYRILFDEYPDFQAFDTPLSFDQPGLRTKIDECVKHLTNQGLNLYRRGDIEAAVVLWRGILTFDPDNVEIRKAIDNATAQQKNLEQAK